MIDIDRKYLVMMMEAGYVYLGMRRLKEARAIFEGLSAISPDSDVPIIALGGVAFCEGDFRGAMTLYRKAMKVDPQSLFAKVYLGEALFFSGKKDEALEYLVEVRDADAKGAAGSFATALLDAIHKGFTPQMLSSLPGKEKGRHAAHKAIH